MTQPIVVPNPIAKLEMLLDLMEEAPRTRSTNGRSTKLTLGAFDGALAFVGDVPDVIDDARPTDLDEPVDMSMVVGPSDGCELMAWRIKRSAMPPALRGKLKESYARVCEFIAAIWRSGSRSTNMTRGFFGWVDGARRMVPGYDGESNPVMGRWSLLSVDGRAGDKIGMRSSLESSIQLLIDAQFTERYTWKVRMKSDPKGMAISFFTTPAGIRELFKMRDINPGMSRRAALRGWVTAHARRKAADDGGDGLAWVKRHLRGRTEFKFAGMEGVIIPARADVEAVASRTA